jgi:hypothetical protein
MNRPKTNATFNLTKTTKRMLALMKFSDRTDWKFQMIDAQMAETKAKNTKFVPKDAATE